MNPERVCNWCGCELHFRIFVTEEDRTPVFCTKEHMALWVAKEQLTHVSGARL
jgi:hypothetical protein